MATPQCYKTESYIGVVRFAVLVGIPVILFLVLILICHWGIDVWEDKQHDRNRKIVKEIIDTCNTFRQEIEEEVAQLRGENEDEG